jgi:uncharacterized membrane protein affecting hemolysin expression
VAQKLMRHENVATTAKYAHAFDEDVLAAMEAETAVRQQVPLQTPLQQANDNQSVESMTKKQRAKRFPNQTRYQTALCPAGRRRSIQSST